MSGLGPNLRGAGTLLYAQEQRQRTAKAQAEQQAAEQQEQVTRTQLGLERRRTRRAILASDESRSILG